MRRALSVLLALCTAAPAFANTQTAYLPFTKTHQDSTRLHVAWIEDDFGLQNNTDANKLDYMRQYATQVGSLKEMLIKSGVEVHTYTYSFFASQAGLEAGGQLSKWANMGNSRSSGGGGYGVALMVGWYGVAASSGALQRFVRGPYGLCRYFRACSTSVQLIHFGMPTAMVWTDGYGVADSALGHGGSGGGGTISYTTNTPAHRFPRVAATGDTFPIKQQYFRLAHLSGYKPPGATLIRLFNYGAQTDSVSNAADDTLAIAWKMKYPNQGYALTATPSTFFVVGGHTDAGNTQIGQSAAPVVWALLSRYVRLPTIPQVFAFNHVGLFGRMHVNAGTRVPYYDASANAAPWKWPRSGALDSTLIDMRRNYNVQHVTIGTQADSAVAAWALGYSKNVPGGPEISWSLHFHTRDSSSALASIHGRSWDAQNDSLNANNSFRRVAFRYDPTNASAYKRYGIFQTIKKSDSIFRANGATPANYMQPGNNFMVPTYALNNDWPTSPNADAVAGRDSMFEAFASAGKTLFCGSGYNGAQLGARASAGNWEWNPLPEETYTTASGKQLRFSQYMPISSPGAGAAMSTAGGLNVGGDALVTIGASTAQVFGIFATVPAAPIATAYGQTSNGQGVVSVAGRSRGREAHATYWGNENLGFYIDYQATKWNLFMPIKALERLAGHQLISWTTPEEAWSRY